MKTLYSLLGVTPEADDGEIEDAFGRLKMRYPESRLAADDNARIQFQGIQQAYKVLSDPAAKRMYDARLARAGAKTASVAAPAADATNALVAGWFSTRNLLISGAVALLVSGMWVYHAREETRAAKEVLDRALKIQEDDRKRAAEQQDVADQRMQDQQARNERRQAELRDQQFRNDAVRASRDNQTQSNVAASQAAAAQRQVMYDQQNRDRQEQVAKQRAAYEAQQRLNNDRQQLRQLCMQRYNKPDC